MPEPDTADPRRVLLALNEALERIAPDLSVLLVYDRPDRAAERPGLARSFFAQRCVPDEQLHQTVEAFTSIGADVRLFEGERPFVRALADGTVDAIGRRIKIVYNGIEGSIANDAFRPGRKSLIPALADSYGIVCANSSAYACALGRHKFHYLTVLDALGIPTPCTWHYRADRGWAGDIVPPAGLKVITKSTYESWSVGVTEQSVFEVDETCTGRVAAIAADIGQAVTVQEFIAGREICIPVLAGLTPAGPESSGSGLLVTPPVETVLAKAPGDPDAVMTIDDNLSHGAVSYRLIADDELGARLGDLARKSFVGLELGGFGRIDFRVDTSGAAYVFDVGVSPGLGRGSSAFASVSALGLGHPEFLRAVLAASLAAEGLLG
ncbi:hypothetical protein KIH74_09125 [Kineosporia sp. J2-2]|uniref:ATP-grasp domain-containing protein n=1 Tax=Kineosporia corallincola TaxID=2835133 RepID=A0ABS5TDH5_9ACTN|nr:hypothetical protein [Kineosporia corallincola]MBT0769086.1 hypothetical protein [Kineosporia corallincola]